MDKKLLGQQNSLEQFISSMSNGERVSSSIILEGDNYSKEIDKIVEMLNGEVIAKLDGNVVKIGDIRKSLLLCHKSNDRQKIFIITNSHAMKPEIYNIMLKSVEEPLNTLFIFCTKNFIAGTIRSRSMSIKLENSIVRDSEDSSILLDKILKEDEIDISKLKSFVRKVFIKSITKLEILEVFEQISKNIYKNRSKINTIFDLVIEVSLEENRSITEDLMKVKKLFLEGSSPEYTLFYLFQII